MHEVRQSSVIRTQQKGAPKQVLAKLFQTKNNGVKLSACRAIISLSTIQASTRVSDNTKLSFMLQLQNRSYRNGRRIAIENIATVIKGRAQNRGTYKCRFQRLKRLLLQLIPLKLCMFPGKLMEGLGNLGKVWNMSAIIRAQANKRPDLGQAPRTWPGLHRLDFIGIRGNAIGRHNMPKKNHATLKQFTLLRMQL
jgi:hypothetical protein